MTEKWPAWICVTIFCVGGISAWAVVIVVVAVAGGLGG